tara:strand:+ start:267 stop:671 length:405 start_codon:yes stop_codon:yes gene_type:complete
MLRKFISESKEKTMLTDKEYKQHKINKDINDWGANGGFVLVFKNSKDKLKAFKEVEKFAKKNKIPRKINNTKYYAEYPTESAPCGYGKHGSKVWIFNNTNHEHFADTTKLFKKLAKYSEYGAGTSVIGSGYGTV